MSIIGLLYLGSTFREIYNSTTALVSVEPFELDLSVIAGRQVSEVITIRAFREYELVVDLQYLRIKPPRVFQGENIVEIIYSPVLGGKKLLNKIYLKSTDRYGLFSSETMVSINYRFTAYPRVFQVAAQAMTALAEMGAVEGVQARLLRGSGTEYAETREYVPGDPLRRFDWKAYAKTTKPMVKDYYAEGGGGTSIVYDNKADNAVSLDELNHAFLTLVFSLTQREIHTQINLMSDGELITYELDRFNTLLLAIQITLRGEIIRFMEYYALLDPVASKRSFPEKVLRKNILPRKINLEYSHLIIISSLIENPSKLYEILEHIKIHEKILLVPTNPWIWQTSLQGAHQSYENHIKISNRFEKNGVTVFTSLDKVIRAGLTASHRVYP